MRDKPRDGGGERAPRRAQATIFSTGRAAEGLVVDTGETESRQANRV